LSNFNGNFSDRFSKTTRISNFMKILSAGAELFQSDGQTDMTKLIVTFCDFTETLKIGLVFILKVKNIHLCNFLYCHNVVVKTKTKIHFSPSSEFRIFI